MPPEIHEKAGPSRLAFESLLADVFRRARWRVREDPDERGVDFIVDPGDKKFVVELKRSAEGRRDRLIPLFSQAILEAQSAARRFSRSAIPVAVVASRHIPESVAEQILQFAARHAPDVGVGIVDAEGFRLFAGFGLERFNAERSASSGAGLPAPNEPSSYLFSDLNQWMLKALLGSAIAESLLSVPRGQYRSGRQLAQAAHVSVMSAARLLRQLSREGFLEERKNSLRLVRIEQLMQRWQAASAQNAREIPARWIIPGRPDQFLSAVRSYNSKIGQERNRKSRSRRFVEQAQRICVGLFAAVDLLGFRFVHGVEPHLYLENPDIGVLRQLGLSVANAGERPDVYVRIPENKEAVFRPVVRHGGVPVADIVQVWLDVSNHPARGKEQAEQIWKRVLGPAFEKARV